MGCASLSGTLGIIGSVHSHFSSEPRLGTCTLIAFFPGFAHGSHVPQCRLKCPDTCSPPTRESAQCKSHNQLFNSKSTLFHRPRREPESRKQTLDSESTDPGDEADDGASDVSLSFPGPRTCLSDSGAHVRPAFARKTANWAGYSPDTQWRRAKVLNY